MFRFNLSLLALSLLSSPLMAKEHRDDNRKAHQLSDEFRSTYKYDKATYETIRQNLDIVVDTQRILIQPNIDLELKKALEKSQGNALKQIANLDKKAVPYLIREHINLYVDKKVPVSALASDTQRQLQRILNVRNEAVEAAIKSIGLNAIPMLSDFHSMAVKMQLGTVASRTKGLIDEIVRLGSQEAEKAQSQKMIADAQHQNNTAAEVAAPSAVDHGSKNNIPQMELNFVPADKTESPAEKN
jgi:hypothetical protein